MKKTLLLVLIVILSSFVSKTELRKYNVKEIPSQVEGTLWIEKQLNQGDTITTLGKTFVILN